MAGAIADSHSRRDRAPPVQSHRGMTLGLTICYPSSGPVQSIASSVRLDTWTFANTLRS
jgi:hypothetical protein